MLHTPRTRTVRRLRGPLFAAAVSVSACLVAAAAPGVPGVADVSDVPGDSSPPAPLGIGDRLFPYLGNPGYDVTSYDLSFTYPGANNKPLAAVTKIKARATAHLDRINLDFTHGRVKSVQVNGKPARFASAGPDLVITPRSSLPEGAPFRITVRHTSDPRPVKNRDGGWVRTKDGLAMANQADAAHLVFPCNDHPSDKADYTIHITAPKGYTAVANGLPVGSVRPARAAQAAQAARSPRSPQSAQGAQAAKSTTWTYRTAHPVATELVQVSVGRSVVLHRKGPHGLPIRDVVPVKDRAKLEPWLKKTSGQIAWMERQVGRYPFETYGVLVADAATGFELETQTLALFERGLFTQPAFPRWYVDSVMVHELSHQWFGNSVSPYRWSDIWLNEGHATWYEALYAQKEAPEQTLEKRMKAAYGMADQWRSSGGPPAAPKPPQAGQKIGIFRPGIYDGAALVLYALHEEIGADAFDRLERTWLEENRDGNVSTDDFVRLASRISGRDLDRFFQAWLYDEKTPPMPGHPDWESGTGNSGTGNSGTGTQKSTGKQK
jgi:aminopeptidase N